MEEIVSADPEGDGQHGEVAGNAQPGDFVIDEGHEALAEGREGPLDLRELETSVHDIARTVGGKMTEIEGVVGIVTAPEADVSTPAITERKPKSQSNKSKEKQIEWIYAKPKATPAGQRPRSSDGFEGVRPPSGASVRSVMNWREQSGRASTGRRSAMNMQQKEKEWNGECPQTCLISLSFVLSEIAVLCVLCSRLKISVSEDCQPTVT